MKPRPVQKARRDFRDVILVPIGRDQDQHATILVEDYDALVNDYKASGNWFQVGQGKGAVMCRVLKDWDQPDSEGTTYSVARLIMKAGKGEVVVPRDGDHLNLMRGNLQIRKGFSLKSADEVLKRARAE